MSQIVGYCCLVGVNEQYTWLSSRYEETLASISLSDTSLSSFVFRMITLNIEHMRASSELRRSEFLKAAPASSERRQGQFIGSGTVG